MRCSGIFSVFVIMVFTSVSFAQEADEIVRRADEHFRGLSSYVEMTMAIKKPQWSREISMKSWSKGTKYSLILITAPARDKGTAFLKRGTEVWNWIPSIEKVIKIPPSMMMQSWMGSDFTNDDLVKESSIIEDYDKKLIGETTMEGRECWTLELIPKPEAPVVWGKVKLWISKIDYLQLRIEYFDEEGELVNIMELSDIKTMGGRVIPTYLKMIPAAKENQWTEIKYHQAEFDIEISENFFSESQMKRVR